MNKNTLRKKIAKRSIWAKSLFALLSIGIVSLSNTSMNAQNIGTYQIGTGTSTINGGTAMPVTNYDYTYSQQIVKATEISNAGGVAGNITKIKYFVKNVGTMSVWNTMTVYLGNTTKSEFTSESDFVAVGDLSNVFSGTVTAINESWMEITLTTPFNYTGENLIVAVLETKVGWSTAPTFYSYASPNAGVVFRRDSTIIDPSNIQTGTTNKFRVSNVPQLRFEGAISSCIAPLDPILGAVTHNTAAISWNGDASSAYEVQYGIQGFDLGTGTIATTSTNSIVLQSLTASSNYQYYIRKVCADISSGWSGPYSFSTVCEPLGAFTQNFDSVTTGSTTNFTKPDCWSTLFTGAGYGYVSTTYAASPTKSYYLYNNSDNSGSTMLISPVTEDLGNGTMRVKFKARGGSANNLLLFGTMSNAMDASTFTQLQSITLANTFQDYTVILPAGTNDYFAFKHGNGGAYRTIYIDDVIYEAIPSCMEPLSLTATNPTNTSVDLSWTGTNGDSGTYEIRYGAPGFVINDATSITVTGQSYQLNIPQPGNYEYVVRQVCTGENSEWSQRKAFRIFNTGEDCAAPIDITSLPYTTTDNTSNYSDNPNIEGSPGSTGCGTTASYLNGNDVVYKYVAANDGVIRVTMSNILNTWSGIFAYNSCADIGVGCIGGAYGSDSANRVFEITVEQGEDYFFVISTNASPQNVGYTLNIQEVLCIAPTNVQSGEITIDTANINWVGNSTGSYEINWGTGTFEAGAGANSITVTGLSHTFEGLNEFTTYRYYIRQVCGDDGQSLWAGPFTFQTDATTVPSPWFEPLGATASNIGWNTSDYNVSSSTSILPNGSGYYVYKNVWNENTTNYSFTSRSVGPILTGDELTFNYSTREYSPGDGATGNFTVAISSDNGVTYTTIHTVEHTEASIPWTEVGPIDLSAYVGQNIKLKFTTNYTNGSDYYIGFDDFRIDGPECETEAPFGDTIQALTQGQTLANLVVEGENLKWYSDEELTNEIPSSTQPTTGTTYYVTQTIDDCESETALAITVDVTLSNNSLDIVDLKVYPNPTSDVLNIDYKEVITNVTIFDIKGRQVGSYVLNATTNSISVDALSSGTYLLKVETETNETSIVKFIKK